MSAPIDLVLSRLDSPKPTSSDRWRANCPACGGTSRSKLSVGVGDNGAVLVRCWAGCSIESICGAVGLNVTDLFPPKLDAHTRPLKRRRLISAGQALDVLAFECMLTWTAAFNLANGHPLTAADLDRLMIAGKRIQALATEVRT